MSLFFCITLKCAFFLQLEYTICKREPSNGKQQFSAFSTQSRRHCLSSVTICLDVKPINK